MAIWLFCWSPSGWIEHNGSTVTYGPYFYGVFGI